MICNFLNMKLFGNQLIGTMRIKILKISKWELQVVGVDNCVKLQKLKL